MSAVAVPARVRRRLPAWAAPAALATLVLGILLVVAFAPRTRIAQEDARIINIVLPPPPPPPPPPPIQKPPEPPKPMPVEAPQPVPQTPPPPTPSPAPAQATAGDNALTAREGAAAGNFGLASGDGSGVRIGGTPGGGAGYGAYGLAIAAEIQRACARDAAVANGRYAAQLIVRVADDGRIAAARLARGSGDDRRDRAISACVAGRQLSQRPPAGLPPVRVEFTSRPGL